MSCVRRSQPLKILDVRYWAFHTNAKKNLWSIRIDIDTNKTENKLYSRQWVVLLFYQPEA